ncbi:MAG: GTP-binding protein [Promethearchaeota archaeon]|nr:MAG: GTP-binding protein [Candidatus Lokiarchaeota archaeon]
MDKSLIHGIIYTEVDEEIGPKPTWWDPVDLSDDLLTHVSIKAITLLTAEQGLIPESIAIIPFPSIGLKGLIKFIQFKDKERRGGVGQAAITLLFNEVDDIIFYKGIEYFDTDFNETAQKITKFEESGKEIELIGSEIKNLRKNVLETLNDIRLKEIKLKESDAFPEEIIVEKDKIDFQFKIIVCGDPMVGKTSTILRFTESAFDRKYIPSIGINVKDKIVRVKKSNVQLVIWDIAGQSKFETMRSAFYKGARGLLLVFDLTNPKTFKGLRKWYKDIEKHVDIEEQLIGFILGNKRDRVEDRKISEQEAKELAEELNLEYIETSALTGEQIKESFYKMAKSLYLKAK